VRGRAEVTALAVDAWDAERRELRVRGKGDRERMVPIPPGAAAAVEDWLAVRGRAPGTLFRRVLKGGRIVANGITTQAVYDVLPRAAGAGVDDLSPHDLRRTYVGDLLDAGADLSTVQQLAGHADVSTTARYDRRGARVRRRRSPPRPLSAPQLDAPEAGGKRRSLGDGLRERGPAMPVLAAPVLEPDPEGLPPVPCVVADVAHTRRREGHDGAAHRRPRGDDKVAAPTVEAPPVRVTDHRPAIGHPGDQPVQQPPARGDGVAVGAHRPATLRRGERQVREIDRDRPL